MQLPGLAFRPSGGGGTGLRGPRPAAAGRAPAGGCSADWEHLRRRLQKSPNAEV
jgi:hypothetical protein